ncbi:MAG: 2-oxo acid dehydrogenase subunit E2 [Desulfobacterota bacterium]|nr:2-oxo acid dehydrogenase subunit E2 [Thermodesulfobacteriota bacterium]
MFQNYKIAYVRKHVKIREERPLSFLRQSVAYVLSQSARTIPHAAMITHYDVTPLVEYTRETERRLQPRDGETPEQFRLRRAVRKNYSAFFVKALAHALEHTPDCNAFLDYRRWRDGGTLYIAEDINVSYTVNTKFGVIKPIVRNPHRKTIETVAAEMRDLTRKARRTDANELYKKAAFAYFKTMLRELNFKELSGIWMVLRMLLWNRVQPDPEFKNVPEDQKLQVNDILGATCTLANNGMMVSGHQTVTVITPPEIVMFGLSDFHLAPQVVDGKIVPRHMVTFFATMDHRAFDAGAGFGGFDYLRSYIEHPEKIYEWKPGDAI